MFYLKIKRLSYIAFIVSVETFLQHLSSERVKGDDIVSSMSNADVFTVVYLNAASVSI